MKTLFYNPMELPSKVKVVSKCFNIDKEYGPWESNGCPVYIDELFGLAKSLFFEEIAVYLTSHNEAYVKPNKLSVNRTEVDGWFSLKGVANGGGYMNDKKTTIKLL